MNHENRPSQKFILETHTIHMMQAYILFSEINIEWLGMHSKNLDKLSLISVIHLIW